MLSFVETVIHEQYTHLLLHSYFNYFKSDDHGALFVSMLKKVFSKYDLISEDEFDYILLTTTKNKVLELEDFLLEEKSISLEDFDNLVKKYNEKYDLKEKDNYYHRVTYKDNDLNQEIILIKDDNTAKFLVRNLFEYEKEGKSFFSDFSDKELKNFYLISPAHLMSYDGFKTRSIYYGDYGYKFSNAYYDFNYERLRFNEEFNVEYCKNTVNFKIKEFIKHCKEKNIKYKRLYSYSDYEHYKSELKKEIEKRILETGRMCAKL